MTSPVQGIKGSASNAVNGFKNMSTKKKVAAAVATVAVVGSAVAAYSKGKNFIGPLKTPGLRGRVLQGYKMIGADIINLASRLKNNVLKLFHKAK